jgi:prepilin-type N-terminal cleavage/methylation domain-containing protein/prepilin-type processing-associated H-X9-DG protein
MNAWFTSVLRGSGTPQWMISGCAVRKFVAASAPLLTSKPSRCRSPLRCGPSSSFATQSGITLVEVLVVMAVIGLLVALILPAVQASRESARRVRCQNQLKQIGLGIHAYHDAFQRIPASSSGRGYSLFVTILPYVDQAPLWISIPTDEIVGHSLAPPARPRTPALYRCPTDPNSSWPYCLNYAANHGRGIQKYGYDGAVIPATTNVFGMKMDLAFGDISDGLSSTVAVAEQLVGNTGLAGVYGTDRYLLKPDELEAFAALCFRTARMDIECASGRGLTWVAGGFSQAAYNHILRPNSPTCLNFTRVQYGAFPATSLHSGGVPLLMVDGHVRSVTPFVDLVVWRAVGSRAGDEVIGEW